mgnify:CR=1 FL=1
MVPEFWKSDQPIFFTEIIMEQTYGVGDTIHHPTSFNCSMFDDNIVIIVIASTLEFSTG